MADSRAKMLEQLVQLLKVAGAPDAEGWARSEVEEDIPQLARFLFLRQAWRSVVKDGGDYSWMERVIEASKRDPTGPGSSIGPALARLLASGCDREDIHEVVRVQQWDVLTRICYLLSDPSIEERELQTVGWALVECDINGNLGRVIDGLDESVLETDPSGREMRPKSS
jgi:hypothetical protein